MYDCKNLLLASTNFFPVERLPLKVDWSRASNSLSFSASAGLLRALAAVLSKGVVVVVVTPTLLLNSTSVFFLVLSKTAEDALLWFSFLSNVVVDDVVLPVVVFPGFFLSPASCCCCSFLPLVCLAVELEGGARAVAEDWLRHDSLEIK